jgi:arylsulfatase
VPAWDSLTDEERRVYARFMEAFAGFLSHSDHQLGRLVAFLEETGELDDTLLFLMSDNGASSEGGPIGSLNDVRAWNFVPQSTEEALARIDEIGGPRIHNNYPWGWTVAGNTPFRRWKREVHEGGIADPLLVHWPRGITGRGGFRRQYVHAIDLVPTILETIGIAPPVTLNGIEQRPLEGVSFAASFADADAPDLHVTQYYEMFGCRAIYHDGWKAVTYHAMQTDEPGLEQAAWELYDVRADPSECHDLAAEQPERLADMVERWWAEAERYQVLPVDNRAFSAFVHERIDSFVPRERYVYHPFRAQVPETVAVNVRERPHTITADVEVPTGGVEGVVLSLGSYLGGWALYVVDGRLRYAHNLAAHGIDVITSDRVLEPGRHTVQLRCGSDPDRPTRAELVVDGEVVGEAQIPRFSPNRYSLTGAGLTCGYARAPAVCDDFVAPFRFTGGLGPVVVEVEGPPVVDAKAEAEDAITSQ